jgi:hypothetical protein
MAGIDLLTGQGHALVKDRHRSREFIEFLTMLEAAYPAATAIKIILDNHSAHVSQETKAWLAEGSLSVRVHPQARVLAQSRRRVLRQSRPLRAPSHDGSISNRCHCLIHRKNSETLY